jgi:uncharacterized protein (TIGR03085 family)
MKLARSERAALADLFVTLGPDQPTLCEGWETKDLLIHLLVRENSPLGAIGNRVSVLKRFTDSASADYAKRPWAELIEIYRGGPPGWNPAGWGKLEDLTNGGEMFIHHEDVRRAQTDWEPRQLDDTLAKALGRGLPLLARLSLGKAPARVSFQTPDGNTLTTVGHGPELIVTGEPEEILLFLSGRDEVRLTFSDAQVAQAVRAARRGL